MNVRLCLPNPGKLPISNPNSYCRSMKIRPASSCRTKYVHLYSVRTDIAMIITVLAGGWSIAVKWKKSEPVQKILPCMVYFAHILNEQNL